MQMVYFIIRNKIYKNILDKKKFYLKDPNKRSIDKKFKKMTREKKVIR